MTRNRRPLTLWAVSDDLKNRVQLGYSRAWVIEKYSVVGLWPSEDELIHTFWTPGGRVLDIGCGAGRTTLPLSQRDFWVTGTDLSPPMVRRARDQARRWRIPATWAAADGTALPFRDGVFDAALFSYNGIELVPGMEGKRRVLSEVCRVLQPGGHFVFTTHALEALNQYAPARLKRLAGHLISRLFWRGRPDREIGEVIHDPNRNLEVYYMQIMSPRVFRRLLAEAGFELIYYNSRQRIDAGKPPNWWVDFDPDFKFYVAQKPKSILPSHA